MFKVKQNAMVATFAVQVAFSLLAGCASTGPSNPDLGTPAEGRSYDRKVVIGLNRKWVNVIGGEVVKFVVQEPDGTDKFFTWRFDTSLETVGDLSKLAPSGVLGRPVKVFVGRNPLYFN